MRYSQRARLLVNGIQSGFHVSEIKCPANRVTYFKFVCSLFLQSFPNQFSSLEILDLSNNMIENVDEMVSSMKEEIRGTHFFVSTAIQASRVSVSFMVRSASWNGK